MGFAVAKWVTSDKPPQSSLLQLYALYIGNGANGSSTLLLGHRIFLNMGMIRAPWKIIPVSVQLILLKRQWKGTAGGRHSAGTPAHTFPASELSVHCFIPAGSGGGTSGTRPPLPLGLRFTT